MKTVVPTEKVDGIVIGVVRPKSVNSDMTRVPCNIFVYSYIHI